MNSAREVLALRCILPGFTGTSAPDWVLRRAVQGLGGVALYARNVVDADQLAGLTAELHAARPDLVIAIDEEGGDVTRLEAARGSSYPGNLALGVANDAALTRRVAASIGAELAAAGVDLDLAPDADVNTNPSNPVIGVRSFGSDPGLVATHTVEWIRGLQGAGVAACAKHFPGHGDTSVDSHVELPVVVADPHEGALAPFEAAIAAGVAAVMSAHLVVPSIDTAPATVSRRVMTGLLREELGFAGLAVTDGLEMRGLTDGVSVGGAAVQALFAGCDLLCVGGGLAGEEVVEEICRAILRAVEEHRLPESRLVEAASRVDRLAAWKTRQPRDIRVDREAGLVAARRAVTADGPVRIHTDTLYVQVEARLSIAAGPIPWGLANPLAARGARIRCVPVDGPGMAVERVAQVNHESSLVIAVRDLHRDPSRQQLVDRLLEHRPDAVLVEMGFPACRPPRARAYMATHGASRVSAEAAAEVLFP